MQADSLVALSVDNVRKRRFRIFLAIAILACLTRLVLSQLVFREFVDDAYIYLRYVDNWDAGRGLVYNAGERVIAFTSYLYVVLIAAINKLAIGLSLTSVVTIFNTLMFAAFCAIMWRFLDPTRLLYWATVIFLFFYFPFIDATVIGMETALFLTVIAATLLALRNGRFEAAIPLAAMAALTRPEGVLLLLPVCAVALGRLSWRRWIRATLIGATVVAVVLVPIFVYFGTVLPQSMLAKSVQVTEASWAGAPTSPMVKAVLLAFGMPDELYFWLPASIRTAVFALFAILLVAFVSAIIRARRRDPAILVAASFYALVVCFYAIGNPMSIPSWYTIAPAMSFALVAIYGIEEVVAKLRTAKASTVTFDRLGLAAAGLAAVLCAASTILALPPRVTQHEEHLGNLSRLGERIERQYPDAHSLMIGDIGIIGYTTKLRIIDMFGLVSPVVFARENGEIVSFGRIVELSRPDIICLQDDPLNADSIKWPLRHRSFDDASQKREFLESYFPTDLGSKVCPFVFVSRALAK
jgi:Gpi18-like mannosyltransferase